MSKTSHQKKSWNIRLEIQRNKFQDLETSRLIGTNWLKLATKSTKSLLFLFDLGFQHFLANLDIPVLQSLANLANLANPDFPYLQALPAVLGSLDILELLEFLGSR
jgi:hypothetical protein